MGSREMGFHPIDAVSLQGMYSLYRGWLRVLTWYVESLAEEESACSSGAGSGCVGGWQRAEESPYF